MQLATIILNYNGRDDTIECVESLLKQKLAGHKNSIVIVDNASKDDSVQTFRKKFPNITVLANTENLGFAQGNNEGIRFALKRDADAVFVLNNDTTVDPSCLMHLCSYSQSHPKVGALAPKIYFYPGCEYHKDRYKEKERGHVIWYVGGNLDWAHMYATHRGVDEVDAGQFDESIKTMFITGCAFFLTKKAIESVGIFDPKLYLYYEDVDLSQRLLKKGFELAVVPHAKVWHKNAQSAQGVGSSTQLYYMTRNRLIVGMRYAPWKTKLALFRESSRLLLHGNAQQRHAIGDFLRKHYGKQN